MSKTELPETDEFLTMLEGVYADIKRVRRSIRLDDVIARELGIDSLDALELLVSLEQTYGVELVGNPKVAGVQTVGDLYGLLEELVHAPA
jgi:acyl carrier protein